LHRGGPGYERPQRRDNFCRPKEVYIRIDRLVKVSGSQNRQKADPRAHLFRRLLRWRRPTIIFVLITKKQAGKTIQQIETVERLLVEYEDNRELTRYVWDHYQRFLTEFEWRVGRAIIGRAKAAASRSPQMAEALNRLWGAVDGPEVQAALADGPETFRQRVRDRLLSEYAGQVFINRCPNCGRIVRTPQARQCFWCGFDWHVPSGSLNF
jgi:hypothetical protein